MKTLIFLLIFVQFLFSCGNPGKENLGKMKIADEGHLKKMETPERQEPPKIENVEKEDFEKMESAELELLKNDGDSLFKKGKLVESLRIFEKGLELARRCKAKNAFHLFLLSLYNINKYLNNNDKAILYAEELIKIEKEYGKPDRLAPILSDLGKMYAKKCNYLKAIDYTNQAIMICEKNGLQFNVGAVKCLTILGILFFEIGDYPNAITAQYEAWNRNELLYQGNRDLEYKRGALINRFSIGQIECQLGQYNKALETYNIVLSSGKAFCDKFLEATVIMNIAKAKLRLGRYDEALEDAISSFELFEKSNNFDNSMMIKQALLIIGEIYLFKENLDNAEVIFRKLNATEYLGLLELKRKNYTESLKYFSEISINKCQSFKNERLFVKYCGSGKSYEGIGNYKKALNFFFKAINVIEREREKFSIKLDNSMTKALSEYGENYFTQKMKNNFLNANRYGFWYIEAYEGMIRALIALGNKYEAFKYSENLKGRVLAEVIGSKYTDLGKQSSSIPSEILEKEEELTYSIHYMEEVADQLLLENEMGEYSKSISKIRKLKTERINFFKKIRKLHPKYSLAKYPLIFSFKEVPLKENEVIIEYEITKEQTYIFMVQSGKLEISISTVTRKKLQELVEEYRNCLKGEPLKYNSTLNKKHQKIGEKLFSILIGNVLDKIPIDSLLILVPDECLATLPFEALIINYSNKNKNQMGIDKIEYLGNKFPIIYAQSATTLSMLRVLRKDSESDKNFLAVVDPIFSENDRRFARIDRPAVNAGKHNLTNDSEKIKNLGVKGIKNKSEKFCRLKKTAKIADKIKILFGDKSTILSGRKCLEEDIHNLKLSDYKYLIFATHGVLNNEPALVLNQYNKSKYSSLMRLTPYEAMKLDDGMRERYNNYYKYDGFLTVEEISELNTAAKVVMLIACETGIGESVKGEGIMGLGRAFQFSGSNNVLMSLWSVAEGASVKFSNIFIEQLKKGVEPHIALFNSHKILQKMGFMHPFFWSPFILLGE